MRIRPFAATPTDYESLANVMNTVWREPLVTVADLHQRDRERRSDLVQRRFMAEINEQVVGYGSFEQNERFLHPQRFWLRLDVLPDYQRQGIGTALYNYLLAMLQDAFGVSELHTITTESRPHSRRFLEQRSFQVDQREPKSKLDVTTFDWSRFSGLDDKIAALGIKIRVLSDLLREDANALRHVYELHQTLVDDVPEPAEHTRVTFESWREGYSENYPYFIPNANFMALHNGRYVGLASLWGDPAEGKLYTGMTGVDRAYRRRGLATALKLRPVTYAQAHGVPLIMTQNNSENPMLQLNLKLGFEIYDTEIKLVRRFAAPSA